MPAPGRRPPRVLVTGGGGFLGAHLAQSLRRAGVRARLLDLAAAPAWAAAAGVEYVQGDVRDGRTVARALEGVDAVVHAAFASPREASQIIEDVNVRGTHTVCVAALAQGARRLVLLSSTIVLKLPRVHPALRDSPLTRLDRYRASRVAAEELAAEYGSRGLPVALVRPKTLVGPGRVGAFALIFESARRGKPVFLLGRGANRYQLLDVRDLADGIRRLAASEATGVFSFGAREFQTVREDLQSLLDHAGTRARLRAVPAGLARLALRGVELANWVPPGEWHYMSARGEDSVVDISRAESELGWRPGRSNARALADAYDWYVRNAPATSPRAVPLAHRALQRLSWLAG